MYIRYMANADLTKLSDVELRRLQAENPPTNNDASNPINDYPKAIWVEGKRRGLW